MAAECPEAAKRAFRPHVDFCPERIRGTDFKEGEIERTELFANFPKSVPLAGIRSIVDAVLRPDQRERSPQSLKAVEQTPPGEVTSRQCGYAYSANLSLVHPIQFGAPGGLHTKLSEQ